MLVDAESEAGWIPGQPELSVLAVFGEGALELFLRAVDAQVGNVNSVAVLVLVVTVAVCVCATSIARSRARYRTTVSAHYFNFMLCKYLNKPIS